MGPIEALERVAYLQDRGLLSSRKTEAFLHAAEVLRALPDDELHRRIGNGTLTDLPGIGSSFTPNLAIAVLCLFHCC